MKFSISNLLLFIALCVVSICWYLDRTALRNVHVANNDWLARVQIDSEREWRLLNALHWGHANMDYTLDYIVPKTELKGLPHETKEEFLRMTRIDLRMDDLTVHPVSYLAQYEAFRYLKTVQLGQRFVDRKTLECLKRFPALKRIEIWNYGLQTQMTDDLIDLSTLDLDGIEVVSGN